MCRSDLAQYGKPIKDLQKYFTNGNDNYPKDMMEALFLLVNYKKNQSKKPAHIYNNTKGLVFAQYGRITPYYSNISDTTTEWLAVSPWSALGQGQREIDPRTRKNLKIGRKFVGMKQRKGMAMHMW